MIQVSVWLAVLTLAVLSGAFLAGQFVLGRRSPRAVIASTIVVLLIYCLLGAEAVGAIPSLDSGWRLLRNVGVVSVIAMLVVLQVWACRWLIQNRSQWVKAGWVALVVCHLVVAGSAGWQFQRALYYSIGVPMEGGLGMEEVQGEALLTDKGRLVPVFRAHIVGMAGYTEISEGQFEDRRIQQAGDDSRANCHGWVFTGGRYLLKGSGVETILADNGYRTVEEPRTGDVIVYRDLVNQIVHTGVVHTASDDGAILIESKWGISGRYLHRPEDQYYSQSFAYYRKLKAPQRPDASSHVVQAVRVLPGNLIAELSSAALVQQSPPAGPPTVDLESGYPMPVGEEYPLGAE